MAIVEDEVRNGSEEETEIEVIVEEYDVEPDSDDTDEEDVDDVAQEKVADLQDKIDKYPYIYEDHIKLIQSLWSMTALDRWRAAYDRLEQLFPLKPEHWLQRIKTEISLAHTPETRNQIALLFKRATLDCYSIPILNEWCTWCVGTGDLDFSREQLDEVIKRAGADPMSGLTFWESLYELEKARLEEIKPDIEEFNNQERRLLHILEKIVTQPLLRNEQSWPAFEDLAKKLENESYFQQIEQEHKTVTTHLKEFLIKEQNILDEEDAWEKLRIYKQYINLVKDESKDKSDFSKVVQVLYDRASTVNKGCDGLKNLLSDYANWVRSTNPDDYSYVLDQCVRRAPRVQTFWTYKMQLAESEDRPFDEVKAIFESALSKGMESYEDSQLLWMSYLEYIRRHTAFDDEDSIQKLRSNFRLAWDSLAEVWGEEANDCEVPLFWARLEYKLIKDPKAGKEIFQEIFNYGVNKTLCKYWEVFLRLESGRDQSPHKLRDLHKRAALAVTDYPPAVAKLWLDFERDHGTLSTLQACQLLCEEKVQKWREGFLASKEKQSNKYFKGKGQGKGHSKESNSENKRDNKNKSKRKSEDSRSTKETKKKRMADTPEKEKDKGGGTKRNNEEKNDKWESKRQRTLSPENGDIPHGTSSREACTLFVSNLAYKVDEKLLQKKLSEYGDIVSFRVKSGVKAFGGSICYCQYKTQASVEEALKHDRTPFEGRIMFLSRYSGKKSAPQLKYTTEAEKNKLFVKNLPYTHCTKDALNEVFGKYGPLKDIRLVTFKDGKPKGLAYVEYEDEESATRALAATAGVTLGGRAMDVAYSAPPKRSPLPQAPAPPPPPAPQRATMRRTQLSSFVPSVLQKASTSAAAAVPNGAPANGDQKRPLSNSDFRNMLMKK